MQGLARRELDVQLLLQFLDHVKSLPWSSEVERVLLLALTLTLGVEGDLGASGNVLDHSADHALGHLHQVVHVGVSHVELADGELRVVSHVDTLVSEDSTDFVHSVKTTYDELLEVELRSDTEEKVELEVVVVGDEWPSSGASGDHVHHGSLYFHETERVKILSDIVDDLASSDEHLLDIVVHNQVDVPLSIPDLGIGQTSIGDLGQHMETRRQEDDLAGGD